MKERKQQHGEKKNKLHQLHANQTAHKSGDRLSMC